MLGYVLVIFIGVILLSALIDLILKSWGVIVGEISFFLWRVWSYIEHKIAMYKITRKRRKCKL